MNKDTKLRIAIFAQAIIILILNNIAFLFIKLEGYRIIFMTFYYALAIALIFISIGTIPYDTLYSTNYYIKTKSE